MISLAVAVSWLWLGMVLAISFLEAPLKFRVLDLRSGLAVGRLVFKALNLVEAVLAAVLLVGLFVADDCPAGSRALSVGVVVVLLLQVLLVRPFLTKRSDAVLAGEEGPRSTAHLWYVGLEVVKVAGLVVLGVLLVR